MMKQYFNQTLTRKSVSSKNAYNEATYTTDTIKARFIYKKETIRNSQSEDIMSSAVIYTSTELLEGDVLTYDNRNWVIRLVYPHLKLDGTILFYKGVL